MSGQIKKYGEIMLDIGFYQEIGKKYRLERSGSSLALFVNGQKFFTSTVNNGRANTSLPSDKIWFIMKVKRYIEKNDLVTQIPPNYKKTNEIKYLRFNNDVGEGEVFTSPYSVDIKSAYWEAAYKAGWISYEIYLEGLNIDKRIRLASLGSFAKRIYQYEFNGQVEKMVNVKDPLYPHVFFNQAKTINKLMDKCVRAIGKGDFLFYWTDGIYVKNKKAAKVCEDVLADMGYEYKTERLVNIARMSNGFVTTELKLKKNGKYKRDEKVYRSNIK